jgi:hypothetical protein
MSAKPVRMLSGVDSVRAADALLHALQQRRDDWPYPHIYPPASAIDVNVVGSLVIPVMGATVVEVLKYQVPDGKRFYLTAVVFTANVAIVPGQALFTVDRNKPVGIANTQFIPEQGLINVPFALGSFVPGLPWPLRRAREFEPNDTVRVKAVNVGLPSGDPNYFTAALLGWELPVLDVKSSK